MRKLDAESETKQRRKKDLKIMQTCRKADECHDEKFIVDNEAIREKRETI
jgi:hypothetical protein